MGDDKKQEEAAETDSDGKTINDRLTRDVEAPRADFEARTPEKE